MAWDKKWYNANRELLNQKRRKRYRSDPAYRQSVLDAQKSDKEKEVVVVRSKARTRARYLRPKVIRVGGKDVLVMSTSVLADALGVTDEAIRQWETDGVIPPATLVDSIGRRWFSARYIHVLKSTPRLHPLSEWTKVLKEKMREEEKNGR